MHTVLFPIAFVYGAPLQIAVCVTAFFALRGFACMVRESAALTAAAARLCERAARFEAGVLAAVGFAAGGGGGGGGGRCGARPIEALVALYHALSLFIGVRHRPRAPR